MEEILVYLSIIHNGNWNKIYDDILNKKPIDKKEVEEKIKMINTGYLTILSENYPICLKNTYKPPFVLFYKGNIELLKNDKRRVAIIGSRTNSEYGENSTINICKDLVKENFIIVSGLAKGIDSIAHKASLNNNGNTIAVLGNGINVVYPKENQYLQDQIAEKGLLLSEYPPELPPNKANFPNRNRIIAALAEGLVIIEAKEKSGTMNTVAHALEDGKPIFCIPERITSNSGCNKLIKEGAKLIENAKDILDEL